MCIAAIIRAQTAALVGGRDNPSALTAYPRGRGPPLGNATQLSEAILCMATAGSAEAACPIPQDEVAQWRAVRAGRARHGGGDGAGAQCTSKAYCHSTLSARCAPLSWYSRLLTSVCARRDETSRRAHATQGIGADAAGLLAHVGVAHPPADSR